MKSFLSLAVFLFLTSSAHAQSDTVWRKGGMASLSFNQVSLTNWASGGDNSIGGNAMLMLYANRKKGKWVWDNALDLAFGAAKVGRSNWRKSDDKIDLNTKAGYDIGKNFYVTYLFGFRTQFTEGFSYPDDTTKIRISNFLTPAYILNSVGIDWKPKEDLTFFLSPITLKTTLLNDESLIQQAEVAGVSLFGVEPGKQVRNELGAYFLCKVKKTLVENVVFNSKLELFSSYTNNPQNIDVNWEVVVALKVNNYISALLTTQLLYDNDVFIPKSDSNQIGGPGTQFKETFGLGFSYKFEGYGVMQTNK